MIPDYVVIDCHNSAWRTWWPLKDFQASNGAYSGLEHGLLNSIVHLSKRYPDASVVLAWDGRPVKNKQANKDYKANRSEVRHPSQENWYGRLSALRDALAAHFVCIFHPEQEADYQIASFINSKPDSSFLIVSTDKDFHQLVCSRVELLSSQNLLGACDVVETWGGLKKTVLLHRAIEGDKSDNLPGLSRVTKKTKLRVAQAGTTPAEIMEKLDSLDLSPKELEKFRAGAELIQQNYDIMNLVDAGVSEFCLYSAPQGAKSLETLARELELNALLEQGLPGCCV